MLIPKMIRKSHGYLRPNKFLSTVSLYDTIVVSSFKNKLAECTEKFILVYDS